MNNIIPSYSQTQLDLINTEGYRSLADVFAFATATYHDRIAFNCHGDELSFAEINTKSAALGAYLINELGLAPGDRVAIQMPNITAYPIAAWAALRTGLIIVNTNPLYTARELVHQFNDSGAKALVIADKLAESTASILDQTSIEHVVVVGETANPSFHCFDQGLAIGAEQVMPEAELSMNSTAVLQYTGGTTGLSKGALLTHGNLFAAMNITRDMFPLVDDKQEIVIAPMPIYHIYGYLMSVIATFLNGGLSALIPNPRDIGSMIGEMKRYSATGLAGVNTLFQGLMAHPEFEEVDFSRYSSIIAGGTALIKEISDEWTARTGTQIFEGYGLSETASALTVNAPGKQKLGTVGQSVDHSEVKVINEAGDALAQGESGEICVRGPHVMVGYWNRPEATAEVLDSDGWFRTGDIGFVDEEGFIKIVDRLKDMIIVSGFNVYPNEVEAVVYGHPEVVECAAVGVPDENTGEAIRLYVVTKDSTLDASALQTFCRESLTAYKIPKQICFEDDLPKSNVGKILRRELRDRARAEVSGEA